MKSSSRTVEGSIVTAAMRAVFHGFSTSSSVEWK